MKENIKCCPLCGGKEGYYTEEWQKIIVDCSWDGEIKEFNNVIKRIRLKTKRCIDCDRVIRENAI